MSKFDLHRYARLNLVPELEAEIAAGADVNQRNEFGSTPLHCAIAKRNEEAAKFLLEHGADATAPGEDAGTALHYAVEYRLPRLVEEILKRTPTAVAISDIYGNEPLWTAAFNPKGDYQLVSLLLHYGANPHHRNKAGLAPVDMAKRRSDNTLLQILESKEAVLVQRTSTTGKEGTRMPQNSGNLETE
jgi:ankyrin repeat protein